MLQELLFPMPQLNFLCPYKTVTSIDGECRQKSLWYSITKKHSWPSTL